MVISAGLFLGGLVFFFTGDFMAVIPMTWVYALIILIPLVTAVILCLGLIMVSTILEERREAARKPARKENEIDELINTIDKSIIELQEMSTQLSVHTKAFTDFSRRLSWARETAEPETVGIVGTEEMGWITEQGTTIFCYKTTSTINSKTPWTKDLMEPRMGDR
jgi:hypothetical protein